MGSDLTSVIAEYATSPGGLWALFGLVLGLIATVSFILHYHWRYYGVNRTVIVRAQFIYFVGVAIILSVTFLSLTLYFLL
ncbi:MAG: hypothetical protein WDZ82_01795 [Candidatus Paceibacterota bacterium]